MATKQKKPAKKAAKVERNLAYLKRKLRPLLPGKVELHNEYTYIIDERVKVVFNFYCNWTAGDEKKVCIPYSISVSTASGNYVGNAGFATRTFKPLVSGDFNYEGILVAVTKAFTYIEEAAKEDKEEKEQQAIKDKEQRDLVKQFEDRLRLAFPIESKPFQEVSGGLMMTEIGVHGSMTACISRGYLRGVKNVPYMELVDFPIEVIEKIIQATCPIIRTYFKEEKERVKNDRKTKESTSHSEDPELENQDAQDGYGEV